MEIKLRGRVMPSVTYRIRTGHGNLFITVSQGEDKKPFEVFANLGKAGTCDHAYLEALGRLVSLALRSGIEVSEVSKQLIGITCHPFYDNGTQILSAPDAVGKILAEWPNVKAEDAIPKPEKVEETPSPEPPKAKKAEKRPLGFTPRGGSSPPENISPSTRPVNSSCPDCGSSLIFQEGCQRCSNQSCGFERC